MRRLTLEELQRIELDILIAFDKMCRDNEIKYSLGYGSMIGAVRHKGFIPWDDDIDVIMVREEYEKLKERVSKDNYILDNRYKVLLPGDKGYPYPFIKIIDTTTLLYEKDMVRDELGVWIDIFPLDYCAQDEKEAMRLIRSQLRLCRNYYRGRCRLPNNTMYNTFKNLLWLPFFRILNTHFKSRLLANEKKFANNSKMRYIGMLTLITSLKNIYPSEYFEDYIEMPFEYHDFMMFQRYDAILTHRYGDYMKLPPENERETHDPEAYMRDV